MSCPNFTKINANNYYAILDKDNIFDVLDDIRIYGEETKLFPYSSTDWNDNMDARELCKSDSNWQTFGNGNAWTTETLVQSTIVIRNGYYAHATLDYDIMLETSQGDIFYLSSYNNTDDMINDYLEVLEDIIVWKGDIHKWNKGTFKMHRNNIYKWIEKMLDAEINKCEKFCKDCSDEELYCSEIFSNGEAWYSRVV